jgi:hypothetical protein
MTRRQTGRTALERRGIRLEPGSHDSPGDGVCVVELASVIAGEPFSDRPACVCEVIAALLRGWNHRASHVERQRLVPYASRIVGSRASRRMTRLRRDICLTWAGFDLTGNRASRAARRLVARIRVAILCGGGSAVRLNEGAGELAARVLFAQYGAETAFRLVDTLLELGGERGGASANGSAPASSVPHVPHASNGNGRDVLQREHARALVMQAERRFDPARHPGAEREREAARAD